MLKVKFLLFKNQITVSHAAKYCGVSKAFMSQVLNSHKKPSAKVRRGLSRMLRIPQKDLFIQASDILIFGPADDNRISNIFGTSIEA